MFTESALPIRLPSGSNIFNMDYGRFTFVVFVYVADGHQETCLLMPGSFTNMQNHSATMRNNSRQPTVSVRLRPGPMKEGHKIAPQERVFLEAAAMGDKHSVMRCLGGSHPVNVNCTDILGRSALQV